MNEINQISEEEPLDSLPPSEKSKLVDVEPLPPTPVSAKAKEKMLAWGMSVEQIEVVRNFSSRFRYDLCAEKVDRLASKPAEVYKKNGDEYVNLPIFYDIDGRLMGQCADIGGQWTIKINENGLLESIQPKNTGLKIIPTFYTGLSRTHFCKEGSNHVWTGLAIVNEDDDVEEEVYVDAAFQEIMTTDESGYKQKTSVFHARGVEINENAEVKIGWVEINGTSWKGEIKGTAVLGVSNDRKYSFSLGFVRDKDNSNIKPVVCRIDDLGGTKFFIQNENGVLLDSGLVWLNEEEESEIKTLLENASKIQFTEQEPTRNKFNWNMVDIDN